MHDLKSVDTLYYMKFQQWSFGLFLSRDSICRVYKKFRMARIVA